jgi:hypothetical protein
MRVIGVEIRVGYRGMPYNIREALLVPMKLVFPVIEHMQYSGCQPEMEFTVHTSEGDVTGAPRLNLPFNPFDSTAPCVRDAGAAKQFLDRQIEAGV